MGVLVLMFELSKSYLTLPVEIGFAHGDNCRTRNAPRGCPCAVNNQRRTGADRGIPLLLLPLLPLPLPLVC